MMAIVMRWSVAALSKPGGNEVIIPGSKQSMGRWKKCLAATAVCATITVIFGYDLTGQYDKKFHEALGAAAKRAVFDLLRPDFTDALDPAKAPVGVKLRLPGVFDSNSK